MASWGFGWKHRDFNPQRCCTVNESSFSPCAKHGNKVTGRSYPRWASLNETQLGLFAWENSSSWTGSSLELPGSFWCFSLPVSGDSQGEQHSRGGVVTQGRCFHHPGWVTPAQTRHSWLQTSTTTDLITPSTLKLKEGCLNIVNCIKKKLPCVVSGHHSCHLNNTGCAGKELPAEIQQSSVGQNGLSGILCQCQGVLLACASSCLHREHGRFLQGCAGGLWNIPCTAHGIMQPLGHFPLLFSWP